jgi:hypothetical protein
VEGAQRTAHGYGRPSFAFKASSFVKTTENMSAGKQVSSLLPAVCGGCGFAGSCRKLQIQLKKLWHPVYLTMKFVSHFLGLTMLP